MLPQVIESRRMAHLAGATKLEKEYNSVEEQFLKLTGAIEKNNINYTKNNAVKVDEAYRNLELMAIKNETIGEVRLVLAQAEKNGAKKYAPQAVELARQRLIETDEFITKNRYSKDEMKARAVEDLFYANRARVLTDQSIAYTCAKDLLADLELVRESLLADGERDVARGQLTTLIRQVQVFGFHFAGLDVRQHSERHAAALSELLHVTGLFQQDYTTLNETERIRLLEDLLRDPRILPIRSVKLNESTTHVLETFEAMRQAREKFGPTAVTKGWSMGTMRA